MARIFVRQRRHAAPGTARPRFAVVATEGTDLTFMRPYLRRAELEQIAQATGAEVIYLSDSRGGRGHRARQE
jgi:hypothetical protein